MPSCLCGYAPIGDKVGVGISTHVPLSSVRPLGQVQTGPLGLSKHSHSHFFLSQGLVTEKADKDTQLTARSGFLVLVFSEGLTLRLLVAVVQNYICGMVHPSGQILNGASAKFIHPEDVVVDVGHAVHVVLKHINAEGLMQLCVQIAKGQRHRPALSDNRCKPSALNCL